MDIKSNFIIFNHKKMYLMIRFKLHNQKLVVTNIEDALLVHDRGKKPDSRRIHEDITWKDITSKKLIQYSHRFFF